MINDLDQIKRFLNIEQGYVDDDQTLCDMENQAEAVVRHDLNRCLTDCEDEHIKLSILFLVANWYTHREPTSSYKNEDVPKTYDYLINQFRRY